MVSHSEHQEKKGYLAAAHAHPLIQPKHPKLQTPSTTAEAECRNAVTKADIFLYLSAIEI